MTIRPIRNSGRHRPDFAVVQPLIGGVDRDAGKHQGRIGEVQPAIRQGPFTFERIVGYLRGFIDLRAVRDGKITWAQYFAAWGRSARWLSH